MDCSTPGFPVPHHFPKFAQVHVHCIIDAIQASHPLTPSSSSQPFPASETLPVSQLFASGDQKTGASAPASVLPMSIQGWFPLRLTGLISFLSRLSRVFSSTRVWIHPFFGALAFFTVQFSQPCVTTGKTIALIIRTFVGRIIHGILQAKILGVGCQFFLQWIFLTHGQTQVPRTAGRFFTIWATREAPFSREHNSLYNTQKSKNMCGMHKSPSVKGLSITEVFAGGIRQTEIGLWWCWEQ